MPAKVTTHEYWSRELLTKEPTQQFGGVEGLEERNAILFFNLFHDYFTASGGNKKALSLLGKSFKNHAKYCLAATRGLSGSPDYAPRLFGCSNNSVNKLNEFNKLQFNSISRADPLKLSLLSAYIYSAMVSKYGFGNKAMEATVSPTSKSTGVTAHEMWLTRLGMDTDKLAKALHQVHGTNQEVFTKAFVAFIPVTLDRSTALMRASEKIYNMFTDDELRTLNVNKADLSDPLVMSRLSALYSDFLQKKVISNSGFSTVIDNMVQRFKGKFAEEFKKQFQLRLTGLIATYKGWLRNRREILRFNRERRAIGLPQNTVAILRGKIRNLENILREGFDGVDGKKLQSLFQQHLNSADKQIKRYVFSALMESQVTINSFKGEVAEKLEGSKSSGKSLLERLSADAKKDTTTPDLNKLKEALRGDVRRNGGDQKAALLNKLNEGIRTLGVDDLKDRVAVIQDGPKGKVIILVHLPGIEKSSLLESPYSRDALGRLFKKAFEKAKAQGLAGTLPEQIQKVAERLVIDVNAFVRGLSDFDATVRLNDAIVDFVTISADKASVVTINLKTPVEYQVSKLFKKALKKGKEGGLKGDYSERLNMTARVFLKDLMEHLGLKPTKGHIEQINRTIEGKNRDEIVKIFADHLERGINEGMRQKLKKTVDLSVVLSSQKDKVIKIVFEAKFAQASVDFDLTPLLNLVDKLGWAGNGLLKFDGKLNVPMGRDWFFRPGILLNFWWNTIFSINSNPPNMLNAANDYQIGSWFFIDRTLAAYFAFAKGKEFSINALGGIVEKMGGGGIKGVYSWLNNDLKPTLSLRLGVYSGIPMGVDLGKAADIFRFTDSKGNLKPVGLLFRPEIEGNIYKLGVIKNLKLLAGGKIYASSDGNHGGRVYGLVGIKGKGFESESLALVDIFPGALIVYAESLWKVNLHKNKWFLTPGVMLTHTQYSGTESSFEGPVQVTVPNTQLTLKTGLLYQYGKFFVGPELYFTPTFAQTTTGINFGLGLRLGLTDSE